MKNPIFCLNFDGKNIVFMFCYHKHHKSLTFKMVQAGTLEVFIPVYSPVARQNIITESQYNTFKVIVIYEKFKTAKISKNSKI